MCLTHNRRPDEAALVAREAVAALPGPQRTEIVLTRAQDVVAAVPPAERSNTVTDLADYVLECRQHARSLVGEFVAREE